MAVQRATDKQNLILAVSVPEERERLLYLNEEKNLPYIFHCPETLREFDDINNKLTISLILTDLEYQNGSLVDWLGLWHHPFILFVSEGNEDKLDSVLLDETSTFLIRKENMGHVKFVPSMIKKVLRVYENRLIQNNYIKITEKQYMNLVQALPDIIYVLDANGNFTFINNAVKSLGWEPMELIGKHFSTILFQDDLQKVSREFILPELRGKVTGEDRAPKLFDERRTGNRMTRGLKLKLKRKPTIGGSIDASLTAYGEVSSIGYGDFYDENMQELGTAGIIREHRYNNFQGKEREKAESIFNVAGALSHNEVMHLINNKLQVLSSLVSLKQSQCKDQLASLSLNEIQLQVYTLSLVYQNMVTINKKIKVKMDTYLDDIIKHLVSSYAGNPWIQDIAFHCDPVYLDEDPAISISLLVSELITYFLKLEERLDNGAIPLSITFLVNNEISQLKFKTSEEIFKSFGDMSDNNDAVLIIKTLAEILNGEIFLDNESLTIFFNIE